VPWAELRAIPVALVTGTNGKTTVVRLITACAQAEGWTTGHSCTDGLYVDGVPIKTGDYSGPDGARVLLRDARVEAAILETARGGILRRGLALGRADAAVVTNISADHFGEYGIQDLGTLADVKLAVAHLIGRDGLLVLNADDEVLRAKGTKVDSPLGWFALNYEHEVLLLHRAGGGATCGVRDGRLLLSHRDAEYDLGAVVSMPLTVDGVAAYNIANLAAAALGAAALGVAPATIAAVFADFGSRPGDNLGRLMRYDIGGVRMLVDYAHNPAGMRGLMGVAEHLRRHGRIAVLLGQAGNREDADLRDLAAALAAFGPDLVVIKEELDYLRGRAPGEVPAILQAALLQAGLPESAIAFGTSDGDAARQAIAWSRPGDVLALLMHARKARMELLALFERMQQTGWQAGQPLPA
jgi:UDP-N-acetylmuramyl tripeptide synthase